MRPPYDASWQHRKIKDVNRTTRNIRGREEIPRTLSRRIDELTTTEFHGGNSNGSCRVGLIVHHPRKIRCLLWRLEEILFPRSRPAELGSAVALECPPTLGFLPPDIASSIHQFPLRQCERCRSLPHFLRGYLPRGRSLQLQCHTKWWWLPGYRVPRCPFE